jgi:hypothetical protein
MKILKAFIIACLLPINSFALSSIQLKMNLATGKGKDAGEANTTFSISNLGVHSTSKEGRVNVVYNNKVAALVSDAKKSYTTADDIAAGLGPMAGLLAQMVPHFSFVETKETMKVRNWTCRKFIVKQDDKEIGHLCAAKMKDLGFNEAEIKSLKEGFRSLSAIQKVLGNQIFELAEELGTKYESFTVEMEAHTTSEILGQSKSIDLVNQLVTAERVDLPNSQFMIPKDYKHVTKPAEIMGMMK